MSWNYILINHSRKDMKTIIFSSVWSYIIKLLNESDWHESDDVQMVYEEDHWNYLYNLVKNEKYTHDSMF